MAHSFREVIVENIQYYSGSGFAQRPISFVWKGKTFLVEKVLAEWRVQDGKCFIVLTLDGQEFQLRHEVDE